MYVFGVCGCICYWFDLQDMGKGDDVGIVFGLDFEWIVWIQLCQYGGGQVDYCFQVVLIGKLYDWVVCIDYCIWCCVYIVDDVVEGCVYFGIVFGIKCVYKLGLCLLLGGCGGGKVVFGLFKLGGGCDIVVC